MMTLSFPLWYPASSGFSRPDATLRWERNHCEQPFAFPSTMRAHVTTTNRELKQQRRRRLRKRHLKSEFALLQTLSRSFHLVYFVKCWQMFLQLNSERLYQSSGQEKKVVVLCSRTRQNVNSGIFTL